MEGAVEKRQHFSGNKACQASISREGKIETSNKSTGNPFKMEVDGPRTLHVCVCVCVCVSAFHLIDGWLVWFSDEVFIGDFIFDSWIRFQCLNKFYREIYIRFKLMGPLSSIWYILFGIVIGYLFWDDDRD